MPWAAVATAVVGAYGVSKQSNAAKDAARAGSNSAQAGIDEQRRQFDTFQGNIQPYLGLGGQATGQLGQLLNGDFSSFKESPGYQFQFDQGMQGLDRSAAARGGLYSGGADADRISFGQGLANQEYGNYWNRLSGLAQMGQNAAVGAGSLGQSSANSIGNLYGNMGQAQAGGAINSANAWSQGLSNISGAFGQYMGGRQSSYQPQQSGQWGAFTPNQSSGYGTLGPSNGSSWNFGGG